MSSDALRERGEIVMMCCCVSRSRAEGSEGHLLTKPNRSVVLLFTGHSAQQPQQIQQHLHDSNNQTRNVIPVPQPHPITPRIFRGGGTSLLSSLTGAAPFSTVAIRTARLVVEVSVELLVRFSHPSERHPRARVSCVVVVRGRMLLGQRI